MNSSDSEHLECCVKGMRPKEVKLQCHIEMFLSVSFEGHGLVS